MPIITDSPYIRAADNPLYKPCASVEDFSNISPILEEMHEHINQKGAHGIAANQIGYSLRMFSVRVDDKFYDYINPKISFFSEDKEYGEEGCLSYPNLFVKIKRSTDIELEWCDATGNEQFCSVFTGLWARVIQHEMDHLDGFRFFDHAGKFHRDQAFNQYKKFIHANG